MKNRRPMLLVMVAMTLAMMTGLSSAADLYAIDVHSKHKLTVFCGAKIGITTEAIKLNPGDSKTVGCVTVDKDINLELWGTCTGRDPDCKWMQVFDCNNPGTLVIPAEELLKKGDNTEVKCVEP